MISMIQQYLSPNRYYHNMHHISNMLSNSNHYDLTLTGKLKLNNAIMYHDVVYDPTSKTNEEDSANYFINDFLNGRILFNPDTISKSELQSAVWNMILSTKDHIPTSHMCKYIIDLDLWGLADPVEYPKNTKLIRKEYSMYSDDEWIEGRIKWIDNMLARKQIYYTDYCIENEFEQMARVNIKKEYNELT